MRHALLLCGVVSLSILTGCGPAKTGIPIGLNVELSGEMPAVGASSRNAAELFTEQFNAKGGINLDGKPTPIRLVVGDNNAKPDQAAAVAQRLIVQENVVALIGPNASSCAIPASEIAESSKIAMMTPWSTNPKTTLDSKTGGFKKYVSRACFTDDFEGRVLAKFALNNLKAKTAAVLYDETSEAPRSQADLFKKIFEENGGKIVAFETFTTGDKDFSAQLTKIKALNPDILFFPVYYNDAPLIAQQARRLGMTCTFMGSDAWSSPELVKLGGADIEGSYFCNHYSTQIATPEATKFISDYTAKYGQAPDDIAALTFDAMGFMTAAIQQANSTDRQKISDAMAAIPSYTGVTGTMRFEPGNGNPVKSAVMLQVKNGAFTWVANAEP